MRAVQITSFGGPEVLQAIDVPTPEIGDDEVTIAVRAIEVMFIETLLRSGWGSEFSPLRPPWIPGAGVAGEVVEVGAKVSSDLIGARVVARTDRDQGGYAEKVVVTGDALHRVPSGLASDVATAALHDGVLTLSHLDRAALRPGSRVLVTAATGSLGQWFVPLAKAAGAYVVAAVGGETKVTAAGEMGADDVVDYRRDQWADGIAERFDVVFDSAGGLTGKTALDKVADGGMFFAHGAAAGGFAPQDENDLATRGVTVVGLAPMSDEATRMYIERGLQILASGAVRPRIGQRVPLESASQAHAAIAARTVIGKTILTVNPTN